MSTPHSPVRRAHAANLVRPPVIPITSSRMGTFEDNGRNPEAIWREA